MEIEDLIEALGRDVPGAIVDQPPPPLIEQPESLSRLREEENREQIDGPSAGVDQASPRVPAEAVGFEGSGRRLTRQQAERIDRGIARLGFDAVAWYRSFHWNPHYWGIFLSETGVRRISELLADHTGEHHRQMRPLAAALLRSHEEFHFHVDVATSSLEIALGAPMYVPRHRTIAGKVGYDPLEEALANACAFDRTLAWGQVDAVRQVLSASPPGYRDFERHLGLDGPQEGLQHLADDLLRVATGGSGRRLIGLERLIDWEDSTGDSAQVPVWLVHDAPPSGALHFVARIQDLAVSRRFEKDLVRAEARVRDAWDAARKKLAQDAADPGLNFEKVRGRRNVFTIRVDLSIRARLIFDNGTWTADRLGTHDVVYGRR